MSAGEQPEHAGSWEVFGIQRMRKYQQKKQIKAELSGHWAHVIGLVKVCHLGKYTM